MIFKHILIGGFLFVTACATATPNVATLEVMPNFDRGLTHKEFRVVYPGAQEGSNVKIKIYKQGQSQEVFHTFNVPSKEANKQKAYYFGLNDAESGKYEVDVCNGDSCSGKTSSLSSIPDNKGRVTCPKGLIEEATGEWQEQVGQNLDLEISELGDWLTQEKIDSIESVLGKGDPNSRYTEWTKNEIKTNPSYKDGVFYIGLEYNILKYKEMFMTKEAAVQVNQPSKDGLYVNAYCERKYLLSLHAHLMEKDTKEVKYRFKRSLYMSPGGKQYFIYNNNDKKNIQVHVEMAVKGTRIEAGTYLVWISLCTTENDAIDSTTMCSDPVIHDKLTVSTSSP